MKKCENTICLCKNCIINVCERFDCKECEEVEYIKRECMLNCNNHKDEW